MGFEPMALFLAETRSFQAELRGQAHYTTGFVKGISAHFLLERVFRVERTIGAARSLDLSAAAGKVATVGKLGPSVTDGTG